MASKSLGTLTLDLVAKTSGFVAGLDKSARESEKWRRKVEKNAKAVGTAIGAGLAVAATAAVAGLTSMVRSSLEAIDAQAKLAQRMRTSYESIANLARAGELAGVSMQQIEVASRSLELNLGKAAQGALAQSEALGRLKLNAEELSALPLDERIKAINVALKENISATERAAVAADLFGSRGATAIQMLDPETLAEAARQAEIFGLNLSDIDAAKVEMAGDAMSNFGLLSEGVSKQLTVELAPILQAIGNEFLRSAEAAGGLGNVVREFTRDAVKGIAFVANAVDGVGVAFRFAARSIGLVGAIVVENLAKAGALAAEVAKYTPVGAAYNLATDDLDEAKQSLTDIANLSKQIGDDFVKLATADIQAPLSGTKLLAAYDKAQAAGQKAAAAAVEARVETGNYTEALKGTEAQLEKISVSAKKIKISKDIEETLRAQAKAQDEYKALVSELRTEEERLNDTLVERLDILRAVGKAGGETSNRAIAAAFMPAPEYAGLAPEIGGAFGELSKINEAQSQLDDWYTTQIERLKQFRDDKLITQQQYDEQEITLAREQSEKLDKIDQARTLAAYVASEELFGSLGALTKQFAGEQSAAYKVLFAAEKAVAISRSVIAIQAALAQASASAPFPANLAAMATVAAQTASIIATIASTTISGQAHDGLMSVPKTGTYLLEKGERVTTADTSAKLDRTLSDVQASQQGGSGTSVRIVNAFDSSEVVGGYLGSKAGERAVMNIVQRNRRTIQSLQL